MPLPYHSIIIDSSPGHLSKAVNFCLSTRQNDREAITSQLADLWTTQADPRRVLPCLSVRSGLDLFLQAQNYPPGSEVIMTAINIPDVARVLRHHKLQIVPVDVSIDTLEPNLYDLERLITTKTVAILATHLFGRWLNMDPIVDIADRHGLHIVEDCAESFCGFSRLGHARSDVTLFSFGVIKFTTSFGGSIVKIRDHDVWHQMKTLQGQYPVQSNRVFLKKVLKYFLLYTLMYTRPISQGVQALYRTGFDLKEQFVKCIRGFSKDCSIQQSLRYQPSVALLATLLYTHTNFDPQAFGVSKIKGDYFLSRLTRDMYPVGTVAEVNNHWLFPVLVRDPDSSVRQLNMSGLAAYTGSTQLSLVEGDRKCVGTTQTHNDRSDCGERENYNTACTMSTTHLQHAACVASRQAGDSLYARDTHGGNLTCIQIGEGDCTEKVACPSESAHLGKQTVFTAGPAQITDQQQRALPTKTSLYCCHPPYSPTCQSPNTPNYQPTHTPSCQTANDSSCESTNIPSCQPTNNSSCESTNIPSCQPANNSSCESTNIPSCQPANNSSCESTNIPSCQPANNSSCESTNISSCQPANNSSCKSTNIPSCQPANNLSCKSTNIPSCQPANNSSCESTNILSCHSTPQANYLMSHVIYLPVNKRVPFRDLDKMAAICARVMSDKRLSIHQSEDGGHVSEQAGVATGRDVSSSLWRSKL